MAIHFTAAGKTNPNDIEAPMLYYPRAIQSGVMDLDALADQVSESCSATPADCYAVIISLVNVASKALEDGKIIRLGQLGSFQVSIKGTASTTTEAVDSHSITSASIIFRPGSKLKKMLGNLEFYKKKSSV